MGATIVDLEKWVEDMMKNMSISEYELDVSGATTKGDGYLGEVTFIKVIANGRKKQDVYDLVVKSAKKGHEFRKKTPIQEAYSREMFMYTKIFPIFEEFQNENTIEDHFDKFAKCYSVCNETNREALILKNLKSAGFEIHDRTSPQNLNHVLFVFRNYGKLHGLSLALKHKKPGLFKSITKNMTDVLGSFIVMGQMEAMFIKDYNEAVEIVRKRGKQDLAKKLEGLGPELLDILTNSSEWIHPCSVILHGDCWNNNMMFKYEDNNKIPTQVAVIDWQMAAVRNSPVYDILQLLYCSCSPEDLSKNWKTHLKLYHDFLSQFLQQLGSDPNIFTYSTLLDHWKQFSLYGLMFVPMVIKFMYLETEDVVGADENPNFEDTKRQYADAVIKDENYYNRIVGLFKFYFDQTAD